MIQSLISIPSIATSTSPGPRPRLMAMQCSYFLAILCGELNFYSLIFLYFFILFMINIINNIKSIEWLFNYLLLSKSYTYSIRCWLSLVYQNNDRLFAFTKSYSIRCWLRLDYQNNVTNVYRFVPTPIDIY